MHLAVHNLVCKVKVNNWFCYCSFSISRGSCRWKFNYEGVYRLPCVMVMNSIYLQHCTGHNSRQLSLESPAKKVFIIIIVVSLHFDPSFICWRPEESPPVIWSPALISKRPSSLIFQSPSSAVIHCVVVINSLVQANTRGRRVRYMEFPVVVA